MRAKKESSKTLGKNEKGRFAFYRGEKNGEE